MKSITYKEFPCDVCLSDDAVEVPHSRFYTAGEPIYICKECGFVYVKKRRSAQKIADVWSDELYGANYTAHSPHVLARQTFVADFIDMHLRLRGKTLVDIGAGEGQFLDIAKNGKYGAQVFGIEPSKRNCHLLGKMGIDYFHGNLESFLKSADSKKIKADIVTLMWTLENCQNPRAILAGAHKLLKDGGHVVIATGSRILVPFKKPLHMYISKNPTDTHSSRFSANALQGLLAAAHFEKKYINQFIDNDILCVIGQKKPVSSKIKAPTDNYLDVYSFFDRWHTDTQMYFRP